MCVVGGYVATEPAFGARACGVRCASCPSDVRRGWLRGDGACVRRAGLRGSTGSRLRLPRGRVSGLSTFSRRGRGGTRACSYRRGVDDRRFVARRPGSSGGRAIHPEFGVLAPFVADPSVTDVFVNGEAGVWIDRGEGARRVDLAIDEPDARELAVRLIGLGGRHIDEASPAVDVRLRDGIRVHVVLPPLSTTGTLLSLRVPRREGFSLGELEAAGFFSVVPCERVLELVRSRTNLLVTGAGGSGNTTWHL